ncbi:MAG: Flp family type IVb pilin [Gemmatimonadota bacterium]
MKAVLRSLLAEESGQDLIEYVLLAALFAVAVGVVMLALDDIVANNFTATTSDLTTPVAVP